MSHLLEWRCLASSDDTCCISGTRWGAWRWRQTSSTNPSSFADSVTCEWCLQLSLFLHGSFRRQEEFHLGIWERPRINWKPRNKGGKGKEKGNRKAPEQLAPKSARQEIAQTQQKETRSNCTMRANKTKLAPKHAEERDHACLQKSAGTVGRTTKQQGRANVTLPPKHPEIIRMDKKGQERKAYTSVQKTSHKSLASKSWSYPESRDFSSFLYFCFCSYFLGFFVCIVYICFFLFLFFHSFLWWGSMVPRWLLFLLLM